MIVNVGKRIIVETLNYHLVCDCQKPGVVEVTHASATIKLPGNTDDAERFIAAYRRVLEENIGYANSECE